MDQNQSDGWKLFLNLCLSAKDGKALASLLDLWMTAEEKENLALRSLIIKELLTERMTQREMARQLKVSIAKITRGSNELKRMPKALLELLKAKLANNR